MLNTKWTYVVSLFALACGVALSFSSHYGIGYIIFIMVAARHLTFLSSFSTYFSRIVLSGLLLSGSVMISGFAVLPFGSSLHPSIVLLFFSVFATIIMLYTKDKSVPELTVADRGDLLAIGISIVAPIVLVASFGTSSMGIFKIAQEGWDNGSHVLMIQDASKKGRYLYGPYESVKDDLVSKSNAYPQAWHLATANISDGFGYKIFSSDKPIHVMYGYVAAITLWMVIACYVFVKISLYASVRLRNGKAQAWPEALTFSTVAVLILSIVVWASFASGFSNYIAMLAYVCIVVATLIDQKKENRFSLATASILFGTMAALMWFLPAPAILLMSLLTIPVLTNRSELGLALKPNIRNITYYILSFLLLLTTAIQVAVFILYSTTEGTEQLNAGVLIQATGVVNGVFPVSQVFFVIATTFTLLFWLKSLVKIKSDLRPFSIFLAILPMVALSICLFVYQMVTAGATSYYLPKLLGLSLFVTGIFLAPAFTAWVHERLLRPLNTSQLGLFGAGVLILGLVVLFSNQSLFGLSKLLERNARITTPAASELVHHLKYGDHNNSNIIVFRNNSNKPYEDDNGKFESRVIHRRTNCSYRITSVHNTTEVRIKKLAECADALAEHGRNIIVVTSNETLPLIKSLDRKNIIIKNV